MPSTEPHQGGADVFNRGQKNEILNIENASGLIAPATSDLTEVPTLIVQHGSIHHPGKQVAVHFDFSEESCSSKSLSLGCLFHHQIEGIHLLHFSRDDFSDGASIASSSKARKYRVGIVAVEAEN